MKNSNIRYFNKYLNDNLPFKTSVSELTNEINKSELANFVLSSLTFSKGGKITGNIEIADAFINILKKTRYKYIDLISEDALIFLVTLPKEASSIFNLKIYLKVLKNFIGQEEYLVDEEKAPSEKAMIACYLFGLFEKDKDVQNRINDVLAWTDIKNLRILDPDENDYDKETHEDFIKNEDLETETAVYYYLPDELVNENLAYIKDETKYDVENIDFLSEEELSKLKKFTGLLGKKINDFISPYACINGIYELKNGVKIPDELKKFVKPHLTKSEINSLLENRYTGDFICPYIPRQVSIYKIPKGYKPKEKYDADLFYFSRLFDNEILYLLEEECTLYPFKPKFVEFFKKHFDRLNTNSDLIHLLPSIYNNINGLNEKFSFNDMTLTRIYRMLNNPRDRLFIDKGNKKLEDLSKQAGINNAQFLSYQALYNQSKNRTESFIPRIVKEYTINGITFKVQILRHDSPLNALSGEFAHNCYIIGERGESSLNHSCTSKYGRNLLISFYSVPDNKEINIAQAWVWRNGSQVCFDSFEVFPELRVLSCPKTDYNILINLFAKDLLKIMKNEIACITVGAHYHDLCEFKGFKIKDGVLPEDCNGKEYTDAESKYVIVTNELVSTHKTEHKYRDERRYERQTLNNSELDELHNSASDEYLNTNENLLPSIINAIYGEDYYLLYDNEKIYNIGTRNSRFEDEKITQLMEIMRAFDKCLLNSYRDNKRNAMSCVLRTDRIKEFYNLYIQKEFIKETKRVNDNVSFIVTDKFLELHRVKKPGFFKKLKKLF